MTKCVELARSICQRKMSFDTLAICSKKIKDLTGSIKEEKADQMLTMLNNALDEWSFISMIKEMKQQMAKDIL